MVRPIVGFVSDETSSPASGVFTMSRFRRTLPWSSPLVYLQRLPGMYPIERHRRVAVRTFDADVGVARVAVLMVGQRLVREGLSAGEGDDLKHPPA